MSLHLLLQISICEFFTIFQLSLPRKEVTDYSWRAESGSCWNKAHMFYIPRGLFKDNVSALEETDFRTSSRSKFQGVDTTSEIYKNKRNATGKPPHKRRRQSKNCQNAEDGGSEVEEG